MRYEKIGIDLGQNTMKVVALRGEKGVYSIKAADIFYINRELFSQDYFAEVRKHLKGFLKENKIKKAALSFSISAVEENSMNHLISLPVMKKKFLKKSVNFELEDMGIIESKRNYYFKWDIVDTSRELNKHDILILGIKKDIINQISKLASVKYKIEHIELQPLTMGRTISDNRLVLDLGQESTRVFYYKEGKPFLIKTISIGGSAIDNIIKKRNPGIDDEDLLRIKHQLSISDNEEGENLDPLEEDVKEEFSYLLEEIRNYIRSIELKYEVYFDEIYCTGGLSNLMGLRDMLSHELSAKLTTMEIQNFSQSSQISDNESNLFFFAISVAMHKEDPYLTNLYFTTLAKTQMDYSPIFITSLCAAMVLNFAVMDINSRYEKKVNELSLLQQSQSSVIRSLEDDLSRYDHEYNKSTGYIKTIDQLSGKNKWLSDILYVLMMETPDSVVVKSMQLQDGDVLINGYGSDYSSIAFIAMGLEKYGHVSINSIKNNIADNIYTKSGKLMTREYEIKLTYKEGSRLIDHSWLNFKDEALDVGEENADADSSND